MHPKYNKYNLPCIHPFSFTNQKSLVHPIFILSIHLLQLSHSAAIINKKLQITLSMGNQETNRKNQWSVATLNFAGIAHSPFEFYSGTEAEEQQLKGLSTIFKQLYNASDKKLVKLFNPTQKEKQELKAALIQKEIYNFTKNEQLTTDFLRKLKLTFDQEQKLKLKWDLANFDKCMQRQRYCPLYRKDAGVFNGHLMTRKQFQAKWDEQFNKNQSYVKFSKKPTEMQIEDCKLFDFLIFKTFVVHIYIKYQLLNAEQKYKTLQELQTIEYRILKQKGIRKKAVIEYQAFLDSHFSKPYLKLKLKLERVQQILSKNDILFLQDASDQLLNALKNQGTVNIVTREGADCAILVKQSFHKIYDEKKIFQNQANWKQQHRDVLNPQRFIYKTSDNKQGPAAVCFVDNFILINVHMRSSSDFKQSISFMKHMLDLKKTFSNLSFIIGGDFSKCILQLNNWKQLQNSKTKKLEQIQIRIVEEFFSKFKIYPDVHNDKQPNPTTSKTRTSLQSQSHKAEQEDKDCRDFLITDLDMSNTKIDYLGPLIKTQNTRRTMTKEHPFDHGIVSATVRAKKL